MLLVVGAKDVVVVVAFALGVGVTVLVSGPDKVVLVVCPSEMTKRPVNLEWFEDTFGKGLRYYAKSCTRSSFLLYWRFHFGT